MTSPSMVQRSGDTLIVRSVVSGDRLFLDVTGESGGEVAGPRGPAPAGAAPSAPLAEPPFDPEDPGDEIDLPQCKIKRNYNCVHCNYFTQNPRHFLTHLRDVHDEKVKIYDCPNCLYASRHFQKLLRHMKMVHGSCDGVETPAFAKRKARDPEDAEAGSGLGEPPVRHERSEPPAKTPRLELHCSLCPFTAGSQAQLTKHDRKEHIKSKFFPCSKCNYVTHIKARFTKHVKYHSMPMIKCEVCDFRTPYKWNLDRHMKNHDGGGAFCCTACNFTADIKQSLTVHEMNHHVPPVGAGAAGTSGPGFGRRRNKVGGSDVVAGEEAAARALEYDHSTGDSMASEFAEDIPISESNSNDMSSICRSPNNKSETFENSCSTYMQNNDHCSHDDMNDQTKTDFKPAWLNEMLQEHSQKSQMKKTPRPIPNLIPLHLQNTNQLQKTTQLHNGPLNLSIVTTNSNIEDTEAKSEIMYKTNCSTDDKNNETICNDDSNDPVSSEHQSTRGSDESSQQSTPAFTKNVFKKKNASFFDKLKEKLLTTTAESGILACKECGHVSKCLSEHSVHEKYCSNPEIKFMQSNILSASLGSTRCQYCRHRCKSSQDLVNHLQTCLLAGKDVESPIDIYKTDKIEVPIQPESEEEASVDDPQVPHPMENVVFVWNSMLHKSNSFDNSLNTQSEMGSPINSADDINDAKKMIQTSAQANQERNTSSGKKVFKCPHCAFWASTASRFHVHIVGHLNKKPFECSYCSYRSNWRWDITKHIRLKSVRDPEHSKARVLMTDETGRRNYSKYNKYLTLMQISDSPGDNNIGKKLKEQSVQRKSLNDSSENCFETQNQEKTNFKLTIVPQLTINGEGISMEHLDDKKTKKTMWKCKKCSYRNISKEALLLHVRRHYIAIKSNIQPQQNQKSEVAVPQEVNTTIPEPIALSYHCGHCNQVSNWKHVIQRHCRLKHNGDVRVVFGEKPHVDPQPTNLEGKCSKCPFTTTSKNLHEAHSKQHSVSSDSIYKCYVCPYYVKSELDLMQHLSLHGIIEPEQYVDSISDTVPVKKYKCTDCPYESNSKSQFVHHEQFHKLQNAPFKCDICNYQVTKRHLLHQHMKVHSITPMQKDINDLNNQESLLKSKHLNVKSNPIGENAEDIPLIWASSEGEFKKMYKCRYCPYVKLRKSNIQDHEIMHQTKEKSFNTIQLENIHQCTQCNYICYNIDVFQSHSKVHRDDYAKVLCLVNMNKSDEQQISELKIILNESIINKMKTEILVSEKTDTETAADKTEYINNSLENSPHDRMKILHFCSFCPARYLFEKELQIHTKFHITRLPYQCQLCSYTARRQAHLMAHKNVHTEDYQHKTKTLQEMHSTHPQHCQPKIVVVVSGMNVSEPVWIVVAEGSGSSDSSGACDQKPIIKQHLCEKCPAKFFKSTALHYHQNLHGGDGQFKCKYCNYAVRTIGNLVRHEGIHTKAATDDSQMDYESGDDSSFKSIPISGTDLFQHKSEVERRVLTEKLITRPNDHFPPVLQADPQFGILMHGNPEFIYPTYLKNGRQKEKRYKCHKCPSAFEKREQYKVHLSLHGSKQRYKCEICDYSVKYYANYVQHMRKHQMNADAHAARGVNDITSDQAEETHQNSLRLFNTSKSSISDQQTLKLLNRRRSSAASGKEMSEDKKIYRCSFCPYLNHRRDALDNHMRRHSPTNNNQDTNHNCLYCDYTAPQSQFLREHLKIHFHPQKHLSPDYYANFEGLEIYVSKVEESDNEVADKKCIFRAKDKEETLPELNIDVGAKIFVVPDTGERLEY